MRYNFLNPTAAATLPAPTLPPPRPTRPADRKSRLTGPADITVLATTPAGHELRANAGKAGVEIRFCAKPAPAVLAALNAARDWHWSRFNGVWYARDLPEHRAWAMNFLAHLDTLDGAQAATPATTNPVASPCPPKVIVVLDTPPPGGWRETDRVPDQYRAPWNRRPAQLAPAEKDRLIYEGRIDFNR